MDSFARALVLPVGCLALGLALGLCKSAFGALAGLFIHATWAWTWAASACASPLVLRMLEHAVFKKRVYRSNNRREIVKVIDALKAQRGSVLFLGSDTWYTHEVPLIVVGPRLLAVCAVKEGSGYTDHSVLVVTVYRPRWAQKDGPLVPERSAQVPTNSEMIEVLEHVGHDGADIGMCAESALPDELALDKQWAQTALPRMKSVVDVMAKDYYDGGCTARVYVLHGHPGCGKSTTLRMLTRELGGVLYASYNPTKTDVSMTALVGDYADHGSPLIVGYEEFDVSFERIARGGGAGDALVVGLNAGGKPPSQDAKDKASWNGLMDRIKRKKYVVLVMTTNLSYDELRLLTKGDDSLLRRGRVDAHFEWPCDDAELPRRLPPFSPRTQNAATAATAATTLA